jgi:hypothetical protein
VIDLPPNLNLPRDTPQAIIVQAAQATRDMADADARARQIRYIVKRALEEATRLKNQPGTTGF